MRVGDKRLDLPADRKRQWLRLIRTRNVQQVGMLALVDIARTTVELAREVSLNSFVRSFVRSLS
jgi:hypothetical protein